MVAALELTVPRRDSERHVALALCLARESDRGLLVVRFVRRVVAEVAQTLTLEIGDGGKVLATFENADPAITARADTALDGHGSIDPAIVQRPVIAFGSSAPESLEPYVKAYRENIKKANPVGAVANNQWANSTLGVCLEDNREAREMGTDSIKGFFRPGRPYVQDQKDVYQRLLDMWGGVPEHLKQNFSRYVEGVESDATGTGLDFSGGEAIAHSIWADLDADTLCDRGVIIAGDPDSCIAALKKHEATGIDQMMIMMQTESVPHDKVMKSIELFGKYVIPEFKKGEAEKEKAKAKAKEAGKVGAAD